MYHQALLLVIPILAACGTSGATATSPADASTTITSTTRSTSTTTSDHDDSTDDQRPSKGADIDITGMWMVTEFSVDGQWHEVQVGTNARHEPWLEIDQDVLGKPGGCNEFGGDYVIDGNALSLEGMMTLMACGSDDPTDDVLAVEAAFGRLAAQEVIEVDVEGESMSWSTSDAALRFVRRVPLSPP